MNTTITYENCDDSGETWGSRSGKAAIPKWRIPETDFEKRVLKLFNFGELYPKHQRQGLSGHDIRTRLILIVKSMTPMTPPGTKIPDMPVEWVEDCIRWATDLRHTQHRLIPIEAFLSNIDNQDNKEQFLRKFRKAQEEKQKEENKTYTTVVHHDFDPAVDDVLNREKGEQNAGVETDGPDFLF